MELACGKHNSVVAAAVPTFLCSGSRFAKGHHRKVPRRLAFVLLLRADQNMKGRTEDRWKVVLGVNGSIWRKN